MNTVLKILPLAIALVLAGCAAEPPKPTPKPAPAPAPPPPVAQPVPAPSAPEWQDLPIAPGSWTYSDADQRPQASFSAGEVVFIIRCDLRNKQVQLLRPGVTTGNVMKVQTSEVTRAVALSVSTDASATPYVSLAAQDELLDAIAFSRGRFSIEVPGLPMLVLPAWPEPARVIEECRG